MPTSITVRPSDKSDPLTTDPVKIVGASWDGGNLILELSQPVNPQWIDALVRGMGSWESAMGVGPDAFHFSGSRATARVGESDVQRVIDYFKGWIPKATVAYSHRLAAEKKRVASEEGERIRRDREQLERLKRVNAQLRI